MSKRSYFRTRFGKQRVSGLETLLKSARQNYYRMFPWIWDKFSWKNFVLVIFEISGLFVKTLTDEYMYSHRNIQNFSKQLQTQLSQKRKDFSWVFFAFFKCKSSLEHFGEKDETSSLSVPKINDPKWSGYLNVLKALLQNTFW